MKTKKAIAKRVRTWLAGTWTKKAKKEWADMLPAEQRVAVARDVLKALDTERLKAGYGYFAWLDREGFHTRDMISHQGEDLQALLPAIPQCEVCAKGALLLCVVNRRDQVKVGYIGWSSFHLSSAMGGLFSSEQLQDIEEAFEGWHNSPWRGIVTMGSNRRERRMRAIMRNIIRHKGTFDRHDTRGAWGDTRGAWGKQQ